MRVLAVLVVVAAIAAAPRRAAAEPSEAERLYVDGQKAYDERRYEIALALWQRSYELSKLPGLLFNIAQAHRLRGAPGDCSRAVETYRRYLALEPDPTAEQRPVAEGFVRDLRGCATATPPATPPAATPVDPTPPSSEPAPPGSQRWEAPALPPAERGAGTSPGLRIAGLVLAGAGVGGVIAGAVFGAKARRLGDEVSIACAAGCMWSDVAAKDADGRDAEQMQWILYSAGGAAILAGGVMYYLGGSRVKPIAFAPRAGGAVMTWSGRW